eukprot:TRINITY_DN1992_c0_g1_i5.p1 TRINITY_DN1992_c0_g1~~TRINITY_DN1992_c0_g1_i5.p1  ORF type:complete len:385 (-),score=28.87 TRINITY_DN1992_c0_g1_i5:1173-2327(-)
MCIRDRYMGREKREKSTRQKVYSMFVIKNILPFALGLTIMCWLTQGSAHQLQSAVEVPRIIVSGGMGSGKSTLLNRLCGRSVFNEGHRLDSETRRHQIEQCQWLGEGEKITLIDTSDYFGTNEFERKPLQELGELLTILKEQGGFNLGLFLIPVTSTRLDRAHIQTMDMLAALMGQEWCKHIRVVLTHVDRIDPRSREAAVESYINEATILLKEAGLSGVDETSFMVCDYLNFGIFANKLGQELLSHRVWEPPVSQKYDPLDPNGFLEFLVKDPNTIEFVKKYRTTIKENEDRKVKREKLQTDNERLKEKLKAESKKSANRVDTLEVDIAGTIVEALSEDSDLMETVLAYLLQWSLQTVSCQRLGLLCPDEHTPNRPKASPCNL